MILRNWMIVAAVAIAAPAAAEVRTVALGGADFSTTPYTFDLGGGNTVTFTTVNPGFSFDPAGVSTGGTTQIASLGAPFFNPPQPTSYFFNRGGSIGPTTLAQWASYSSPAVVKGSIVKSLVGLRFDLGQGYQYGYADIAGSTLFGFRYETTPNTDVAFGAVPEPSSWAMMIIGFGLVAGTMRLSRRGVVQAQINGQ